MTKDVFVTIEGNQLNTEAGILKISASGAYNFRNGKHYIQYVEGSDNENGITKNLIKISSTQIDMIKRGSYSTNMVFDITQATQTVYQTPFGSLSLQIETTEIQIEENGNEIIVKLCYTLSSDENHISDNRINIRISSYS